tara:strand:- start:10 stop:399 length:390 start_codon:yes stop_codon:yes gene_type:complete
MKIKKNQLKKIIKEELDQFMAEMRGQTGIDWDSMLAPGKYPDSRILQMMELIGAGGMGDRHQAEAERFANEFKEALDKLESVGGLENKNNWSDEQATMMYNVADDLQFYRRQGARFLESVGLLGKDIDQ